VLLTVDGIKNTAQTNVFVYYQVEDDEAEEDAPLEKRKKMFTKECKPAFISCLHVNETAVVQ